MRTRVPLRKNNRHLAGRGGGSSSDDEGAVAKRPRTQESAIIAPARAGSITDLLNALLKSLQNQRNRDDAIARSTRAAASSLGRHCMQITKNKARGQAFRSRKIPTTADEDSDDDFDEEEEGDGQPIEGDEYADSDEAECEEEEAAAALAMVPFVQPKAKVKAAATAAASKAMPKVDPIAQMLEHAAAAGGDHVCRDAPVAAPRGGRGRGRGRGAALAKKPAALGNTSSIPPPKVLKKPGACAPLRVGAKEWTEKWVTKNGQKRKVAVANGEVKQLGCSKCRFRAIA